MLLVSVTTLDWSKSYRRFRAVKMFSVTVITIARKIAREELTHRLSCSQARRENGDEGEVKSLCHVPVPRVRPGQTNVIGHSRIIGTLESLLLYAIIQLKIQLAKFHGLAPPSVKRSSRIKFTKMVKVSDSTTCTTLPNLSLTQMLGAGTNLPRFHAAYCMDPGYNIFYSLGANIH